MINTIVILFIMNSWTLSNNFSITYAGSYQNQDLCEKAYKDIVVGLDQFVKPTHRCIGVQVENFETEADQE